MPKLLQFFQIRRLHIFTDGETSVIAYDPNDAIKVWEEWAGDKWDTTYDPLDQQVKDNVIYKISCEPGDFDDFKKHRPLFSWIGEGEYFPFVAAPAWLWCLYNGRGFLCSTEF